MSTVDIALIEAYLSNIQLALQNLDVPCAESLLEHTLELLVQSGPPRPPHLPMQICTGVGLDVGIQRKDTPNQDFVFATTGYTQTQETYGMFVVADGMGGHAKGQVAARLGTQTIVDALFPLVHRHIQGTELGDVLVDVVNQANTAIYEQNQKISSSRPLDRMGTTVTTALVIGPHAFIANVGDSRMYLYRPDVGLRAITRDHSVVAEMVASGAIDREDIYTHPERNKILRCLGATPTVEVDLFYEQLQHGDILLCCSDGVWEMTRDPQIEQILSSSGLSVERMAENLMHAALQGGGLDNIGLVVSQFLMNVTAMQTIIYPLSSCVAVAS